MNINIDFYAPETKKDFIPSTMAEIIRASSIKLTDDFLNISFAEDDEHYTLKKCLKEKICEFIRTFSDFTMSPETVPVGQHCYEWAKYTAATKGKHLITLSEYYSLVAYRLKEMTSSGIPTSIAWEIMCDSTYFAHYFGNAPILLVILDKPSPDSDMVIKDYWVKHHYHYNYSEWECFDDDKYEWSDVYFHVGCWCFSLNMNNPWMQPDKIRNDVYPINSYALLNMVTTI